MRNASMTSRLLLVAGFAIAARSMTSRCNNSICGDIDRGGQNSNCFEGRNDEKPEMAADSNHGCSTLFIESVEQHGRGILSDG
jgi:hypothetical protein